MSFRVIAASLFSCALVAVVLVFWAHVPGPIGLLVAAIVGVGALIGLTAIDDKGEELDAAWRAAAPDLATPEPPAANLAEDPELPAILAAQAEAQAQAQAATAESAPDEASAEAPASAAELPEDARPDESA